jgi:hypothetical protein
MQVAEGTHPMMDVLSRAKNLLVRSQNSDWAALSPDQVITILDREMQSLMEDGRLRDKTVLASLFAPTADIQEIAMANEWSDAYLQLSSSFDAALKHCT